MRNKRSVRFMPAVLMAAVMVFILLPMGFKTVKAAPTGSGTETDPLVVDNFTDLKAALESNEDLYIVVDTFQTTSTSGYTGLYAPDDYVENGFAIQSNGKKVLKVTTTIDCRPLSVSTLYSFIRVNGTLEIKGTGTITCGFNGQRPNAVFYVMYPGVLIVNDGITIKGGYGMEPNYHGAAVYNYSGTVTIKGGTFWGNTGTVGESTATVSHQGGTTTIEGGSFNVNDEQNNPNFPSYGFYGNDDNIILSGGTYQGITAPSGQTIGDMLATGYETYTDSWALANAESLNSYTGILRIAETPPTYNIHVNNGIATPASAKPGEIVTLTADPIPTGYIFYKWDIVAGTFTLADEEVTTTTFVMPAEDVAVSAVRTSVSVSTGYTVSFDPNGGSGTMDSVTDVPAGSYTLPSNGFTAPTSKEFDQWEVGGTRYNGGDTITINSDISVKALWKYVAPIAEISVNGFESPVAGKKAGDYLNLTVPNGCHYYIDYKRWYDSVTGPLSDEDLFETGRNYYCSMLIYTEGSYVFDDALQFFINDSTVMVNSTESELISTYARLMTVYESPSVPATYAVTFDANGHGTAPATQTVEDGKTGTKPANPAETGWIFGGWYTEAACTNAFDFSTPITADIKLYAKWTEESVTPVSYTVTFEANGHGTAPAAQTVEDGKTGTKPADPAETGWIFGGWYTETACTNAFDFSTPITADIKLYAKWTEESVTPVSYTVTFDANGHGTAPAAQTVEDGKTGTKPADPAETGWIFGGWYTETACTNAFDFATPITADIKLFAKWTEESVTPVSYTVTFEANGHGTAPATQTVEDGKTGTKPADPAETGWIFGGWYTETACTNAFDFSTPITADIKLYAKWTEESVTPVSYTVTFEANGHGTAPATQTVEDGKTGTKPADPAETGWIFGGWYTETACTNAFDFSTPITADIKLFAKWTEEKSNTGNTNNNSNTGNSGSGSNSGTAKTNNNTGTYTPVSTITTTPEVPGTTTKEVKNADGSKTTTTRTLEESGKVTETTVKESKNGDKSTTEVVTDGSGKIVSTIIETMTTNKSGTTTVSTTVKKADGSLSYSTVETYKSGKVVSKITETNADKSKKTVEETKQADGSTTKTVTKVSAGGSAKMTVTAETPAADDKEAKKTEFVYSMTESGKAKLVKVTTDEAEITIPAAITINGVKCKVVTIGKSAFKGNTSITKIVIGKYVETIGTKAFAGLKDLNEISISSSKLRKVSKSAFYKISKDAKFYIKAKKSACKAIAALITGSGVKKVNYERVK